MLVVSQVNVTGNNGFILYDEMDVSRERFRCGYRIGKFYRKRLNSENDNRKSSKHLWSKFL